MRAIPIYCRHPPTDGEASESARARVRRGMRVSAPLGLAIAVTAALACQSAYLTAPSFADGDPAGIDATGTVEAPDSDRGDGGAGGNGTYGETW